MLSYERMLTTQSTTRQGNQRKKGLHLFTMGICSIGARTNKINQRPSLNKPKDITTVEEENNKET